MKTIGIIPVRGGSIRVPRKNVKPFCGHPLMAWTIRAALNSKTLDEVYVSTDDDEMERVAYDYGIKIGNVIRRPYWPDADSAAGNRPYLHAVETLTPIHGDFTMVQMFATSPQRKPDDIDRAVLHQRNTGAQVSAFHRKRETFIYRDKGGIVAEAVIADKFKQHFELASGIVSVTNSRWYTWFQSKLPGDTDAELNELMRNTREMPNNQSYYIEVEAWQVPETDSPEEFELCELIMERYILQGKGIDIYG